jgi:Protein of unknown function (DUF3995)
MTPQRPTASRGAGGGSRDLAALVLAIWCATFGALHAYWAVGGRLGLGETSAEAETAFEQPWFAAYNGAVIVLSAAGTALAIAVRTGHLQPRRSVVALLMVTGAVLLLRGAVGWVSLLATVVTRGNWNSPFLLIAVEAWFVAGGIFSIWLGHRMSGRSR